MKDLAEMQAAYPDEVLVPTRYSDLNDEEVTGEAPVAGISSIAQAAIDITAASDATSQHPTRCNQFVAEPHAEQLRRRGQRATGPA